MCESTASTVLVSTCRASPAKQGLRKETLTADSTASQSHAFSTDRPRESCFMRAAKKRTWASHANPQMSTGRERETPVCSTSTTVCRCMAVHTRQRTRPCVAEGKECVQEIAYIPIARYIAIPVAAVSVHPGTRIRSNFSATCV